MTWRPATIEEVKRILADDLTSCDAQQLDVFRQYAVDPYRASIERYGKLEEVVVVAQKLEEVMYWEDVEEGFNISRLGSDRRILEHWCNRDDLATALNWWIEGRKHGKIGPAQPVNFPS